MPLRNKLEFSKLREHSSTNLFGFDTASVRFDELLRQPIKGLQSFPMFILRKGNFPDLACSISDLNGRHISVDFNKPGRLRQK